MKPRRIWADFTVFARGYFRNPAALFFSLIFPIILILLFGLIFSSPSGPVTLYTLNLDHNSPVSQEFLSALNQTGAVKVQLVNPAAVSDLAAYLGQQGQPVGLVVPAGFQGDYLNRTNVTVSVYVNPQDASDSGITMGAVQGVLNGFNLAASGGHPFLSLASYNVGSNVFKYIDYLVPGLIGFSILTSPMFSMVEIASDYRKQGLFRQLSLTPLTKAEWLSAKILWYVVLTFLAAALMIGFGAGVFGAHVTITPALLPFLILGPLFFVSLGMLAGSVAKTPESAAVIGNIVTFPMMFLSGTFFPVSSFPPGLQDFARLLPLYYVIDGMNQVMLFHNTMRALVDLVVLLVASIVVFVAAVLAFKWRDE